MRRKQRRRGGKDERGQDEKEEPLLFEEPVFCVHGKGERRHREEGEEVDALRRRLRDAEKQRQKGDERRPPAHAHAAQDPAQDAAQKEEIKAHGRSNLTPAASMTNSNKRETALNESFPNSFAPNAPPRSTPNATGKKMPMGTSPSTR